MSKVHITLATGDYDRTLPLQLGTVQPEGIALNHLTMPVEDIFWRMCQHHEFDASELSCSAYMTLLGQGQCPFVAIPVFLSRMFRHSCVFVNTRAAIRRFEDLRGKAIGVPEYAMTAIVWLRGILHHEHGVAPDQVTWVQGGLETSGRTEKVAFTYPPHVRVEPAPAGKTLNGMLAAGDIPALFTARAPSAFVNGSPHVARLFPNYKEIEQAYYRKTGVFPIMHTVVIKRHLYERHPWVARSLYRAFARARQQAFDSLYDMSALRVMLPWLIAEVEAERAFFGDDFWPYGVEPNRVTLETLTLYAYEQGLTPHKLEVESLFAANTLDDTIV